MDHILFDDYGGLDAVTKADNFPLPHIVDLFDDLGYAKYFSTLDLVSGFWQILVHANSQEKTAFSNLFKFIVIFIASSNH